MKNIRANALFWGFIFLSLLPFIILSFFSHPGKEDYFFESDFKNFDFWNGQRALYGYWSGRFFVNAAELACVKLNFISDFYFLLTLLLFLFTALATLFLVRTANKLLLCNTLSVNQLLQVSFIFLLLNIYLMADIGSNFYWFSAAIVYQTPVILLLALVTLIIKRFQVIRTKKMWANFFITILIILLIGCNETFAVATIIILFFASVLSIRFQSPEKKIIIFYFLAAFITGMLVFFTSGILNRQKMMHNNTSYVTVLPVIAFRTWIVFYHIFKEPLFWISSLLCLVSGAGFEIDARAKKTLFFFKNSSSIYYALLLLPILVAAILTPLLLLAKGSFPERALNNIILIAAIYLLVLAFISGHTIFRNRFNSITEKMSRFYRVIVFGAGMLFSVTYTDAWKSVFSGYFYHAVLLDRDKQFARAKNNNQKTITILDYDAALKQKIKEKFPGGGFTSVSELLSRPPVTIPFFNEAEENRQTYYQRYYGTDRIIIQPDKP